MTATAPWNQPNAETEPLHAGIALQGKGLKLLFAEMQALVSLLPGHKVTLPTKDETEAAFDNLPVQAARRSVAPVWPSAA